MWKIHVLFYSFRAVGKILALILENPWNMCFSNDYSRCQHSSFPSSFVNSFLNSLWEYPRKSSFVLFEMLLILSRTWQHVTLKCRFFISLPFFMLFVQVKNLKIFPSEIWEDCWKWSGWRGTDLYVGGVWRCRYFWIVFFEARGF